MGAERLRESNGHCRASRTDLAAGIDVNEWVNFLLFSFFDNRFFIDRTFAKIII